MSEIYQYPLIQHIGAKAEVVVARNDKVKRGQMLATGKNKTLGSNIFSSVNGIVLEITDTYIQIEETETNFQSYEPLTKQTPLELIEESGLVGLGGAGFPTYVKLGAKLSEEGVLIVNAAECEPILNHNTLRIEQEPQKLIRGMEIVMKILGISRGVVAIKENHEEAITALNRAIPQGIEIKPLKDLYPMGEERAIIRETLGITLSPEELPTIADALVINVETVLRIREAVEDKRPLIDKDLTVAGKLAENGKEQVLLDVPLGRKVSKVFEAVGGIGPEYGEIIMGGPFTGKRCQLNDTVVKTTNGLIATENFMKGPSNIGLLVCACGANKDRLEEMAASMGSKVVGYEYCKQAIQKGNAYKCENPGKCPGQVGKVMSLKKAGAQALLISNCTDCTNTVMSCAPQMGLPVYHCTDGSLRATNHKLIRKYHNGGTK